MNLSKLSTTVLTAILLSSCTSQTPCHKDLSRPLSSCPVRGPMVPTGDYVTFMCPKGAKVTVRAENMLDKDYCFCVDYHNRHKAQCR